MREHVTSNSKMMRVIRVILVFALVFWSSFNVEALAFAAIWVDNGQGHEAGTLSDLDVWEVDQGDSTRVAAFVRDVRDTAAEKPQAVSVRVEANSAMSFVAVPAWASASAPSNDAQGAVENSLSAQADGEEGVPETPEDVIIADFVEWKVSDESIATLVADGGFVTLTGRSTGTVTVTCSLKVGASDLVAPSFAESYPDSPFEVTFEVDVTESSKPYVSSLVINKPAAGPDGSTMCTDGELIVLTAEECASYSLWVQANVYDRTTDQTAVYDCTPSKGLAELSAGRFSDLAWRAENADGTEAAEDDITVVNGVITLKGVGTYTVRCISSDGLDGTEYQTYVKVQSESAVVDPQGEYNPQDELTITIDVPVSEGAEPASSETGSAYGGSGDADDASPEPDSADAGDVSSESVSGDASDGAVEAEVGALASVSKTYTLEELESTGELGFIAETYTMSSSDGDVMVAGRGPTLAALIYHTADPDGSLNLSPASNPIDIESVEFVIAGGRSITVAWSDLVAVSAPNNIILAAQSRVMVEGDGGPAPGASESSGSSGSPEPNSSATELLDNTRFRLLYNGAGSGELVNPDSFCWISGVVVHVKGDEPEIEPIDDSTPYVAYTPVKKGEWAYLIPQFTLPDAVNNGTVQFHYEWQWSSDGDAWQSIASLGKTDKDRGQQLEVLTDDSTIGTYRRFILTLTLIDGATGETASEQSIESRAVVIEEGSGFRVKLDYVPPIAGDTACFTAIPEPDANDDEQVELSQIYYEWQMSTDYGRTWIGEDSGEWPDILRRQSGVQSTTLRIPTQPISDSPATSDDGSEDEPSDDATNAVQMTWIRVVAHYNGKKTPSDPVPLTVHVGDTSGGKAKEIQQIIDAGAEKPDDAGDAPTPRQPSQTQVTELDRIVFENPATGAGTQPSTQSQVYVNDTVTEAIVEQQQTAREEAQAKPGARWVELSSVNPTDEDVRNILSVNPFAPFAAPLALGITAAGVVEKIVGFRRETR